MVDYEFVRQAWVFLAMAQTCMCIHAVLLLGMVSFCVACFAPVYLDGE